MVRQTSELPAQRRCEVLLLDTNGYTAGLDTKIPVGRIVCDSTFDSYSLPRFSIFCTKKSVSQPWALRDGRDDAWSA